MCALSTLRSKQFCSSGQVRRNFGIHLEPSSFSVNARESIRVTGGNIDWVYPGRNELTSYTID